MNLWKKRIAFLCFPFLLGQTAVAQVRLPRLIRDSMVLQRDTELRIWGWAAPGEKINIRFRNKNFKANTRTNGKWMVTLPPYKAGGPYDMQISGSNSIVLKDILVGDVWLCAGQSNMVLPMERVKEKYAAAIAAADYPQIRHFFIATTAALEGPKEDLASGNWKAANPQDVLQFSATAFFFAKDIYDRYKIPVGLINASVGGTPIEAWTSEAGLQAFPDRTSTINRNRDSVYVRERMQAAHLNAATPQPQDEGLTFRWFDTAYHPKGWYRINVPGYWEDQGIRNLDGIVWYRKEIHLPASMTNKPARLYLGRIIDADDVYVNGKPVGSTGYQYPPRRYTIAGGILQPGSNTITVRVRNYGGKGGFVPDKNYELVAGDDTVDLKGEWQYKVGAVFSPVSNTAPGFSLQNQPAALFQGMIAPLTQYRIKGFLWYQGESNVSDAADYETYLKALIADWRKHWKQGELPFVYAQLPNFGDVSYLPSESNWALLQEAQMKTLSVPNTAMAVTIDLGEWNDIHPLNKKDVGERLAVAARNLAYGEAVPGSGPIYKSSKIEGNKIRIDFTFTGSGLTSLDGEPLRWFAIAGDDRKFVWAQAMISDNQVVVWNEQVPNPKFVRYAWADNPRGVNLYNREGLPAAPFRTDDK